MSDYTDPELRSRVKAEVLAGDKGGRPGHPRAAEAVREHESAHKARKGVLSHLPE